MYKIVSISNTMTNFVVKSPEGSSLSVNLLPNATTYTVELTDQIRNLELNKVLRIVPADNAAFSLGNANLVDDNVGHLAIPVEPQLAVAASFGRVNKTAMPKNDTAQTTVTPAKKAETKEATAKPKQSTKAESK